MVGTTKNCDHTCQNPTRVGGMASASNLVMAFLALAMTASGKRAEWWKRAVSERTPGVWFDSGFQLFQV